jgi:hypothetical protein
MTTLKSLILNKYFTIPVLAILILSFCGYKLYNAGYDKADAYYKSLIAAETAREIEIHDKVVNAQKELITALQNSNEDLDKKLKEVSDEADKDPDAGKHSLSSSAVVRIDSIH